jgi:hypothetical protein
MSSKVNWQEHPAVVVWSDDWGMNAWAPNREAYQATLDEELMQTRWSSGSLETPADLERTFQLLEAHRSGDGLPIVFEPYYIVGAPDYDAMHANGFRHYVDIGIDQGVSQSWERGDTIAKAREGMDRGVWAPQYHGRTHHFSHHRWLTRLREGETRALRMFAQRMYVSETVRERVPEHEDMAEPERKEWVRGALSYFIRAFGFAPESVRNSDEAEIAWATQGLRIRVGVSGRNGTNLTGESSPIADLWYAGSAINFEPFLTADQEDILARVQAETEAAWHANRPAFISSHRRNFTAFTDDVDNNFAVWDAYLTWLETSHSNNVFITMPEVHQLWESGISTRRYGNTLVFRNWTDKEQTMTCPAGEFEVVEDIVQADDESALSVSTGAGKHILAAPPGNYLVSVGTR